MPSSRSERQPERPGEDQTGGDHPVSSVEPALRELIAVSVSVGADPDLVQGGGGNASVKSADGKRIYVKASGTPLAEMSAERGWAELDLPAALAVLDRADLRRMEPARREAQVLRALEDAVLRPSGARPSVESSLHALLDRVVIHTHPVGLGAFLSSRQSARLWPTLLEGIASRPPLYIGYVDPGFTLAVALKDAIASYEAREGCRPDVVLLENHGLFVAADSGEEALELTLRITLAGQEWIGGRRVNPERFDAVAEGGPADVRGSIEAFVRGALLRGGASPALVRRDPTDEARRFAGSAEAVATAGSGAFTPDQIVYCRTCPLVLAAGDREQAAKEVSGYREDRGVDPRVIIVPGEGVFYAAADLAQIKVISEVYRGAIAAIRSCARGGGPRLLTQQQAGFIEEWEVENYRASLLAAGGRTLTGRVAVVTGAGSGLGRGIALGLVEAGATVVGLDVDRSAVEDVAASQPAGRFLPLACDVTSEESVRAAFAAAAASAGGIDYLVNAAGIAPAFALVDFPVEAWRKALEINLTGYFLCAREAARWLQEQGAGGSIINLTSKTGLDASKANSAYNATKAGEIHLMRGWALELGADGIRVNCVAPGNVFKGSKIWNDEYIRVCARKRGISPEEVIPYYISLAPLGKEIEPRDIADAVVFLLSDAARNITGQVLVVDGGQVMVR
ncbi:MAG: SDR family oxidoreductase [Planctomycetes bacterium]|nr:SDR family oxidoreductase [Planctomycetota bacterium]